MRDLKALCEAWDGSSEQFAQIVTVALLTVDPRDLAEEFEAAVSTVERWADGRAKPRPRVQQWVVQHLAKR